MIDYDCMIDDIVRWSLLIPSEKKKNSVLPAMICNVGEICCVSPAISAILKGGGAIPLPLGLCSGGCGVQLCPKQHDSKLQWEGNHIAKKHKKQNNI